MKAARPPTEILELIAQDSGRRAGETRDRIGTEVQIVGEDS